MEDAGTPEEDDIDSQDSNTPIDHGHLARNCSIKIRKRKVSATSCPIWVHLARDLGILVARAVFIHHE